MLGVLFPYARGRTVFISMQFPFVAYPIIIRNGVGWLSCLSRLDGQCEGLGCGISGESFSHVFFVSTLYINLLIAEAGGVVGDFKFCRNLGA